MRVTMLSMAAGLAASLTLAGGALARDDQPANGALSEPEEADVAMDASCSDGTIRGDYAFSVEGSIVNGPTQGLLRVVGVRRFDGHGLFTQVDFSVTNGVPAGPDWRPGSGTYQINEDCTGSLVLQLPGGAPPIQSRLVVSDRGRRIRAVVIGNPTASESTRIR